MVLKGCLRKAVVINVMGFWMKLKKMLFKRSCDGFTSYKQAMDWINNTFGLQMEYHAVNKYLKRTFGTKLKVGRNTHINKHESAYGII